jgi:hypothetical protein
MYRRLIATTAGLALAATWLLGQTTVNGWREVTPPAAGAGIGWQQAGTLVGPINIQPLNPAISSRTVTGSPFSATEERHTVQTLGDGTVLENSESTLVHRDTDGRTRMERTQQGKTIVTIVDPVARTTMRLDPVTKTARKVASMGFGLAVPTTVTAGDKAAFEGGMLAGMSGRGAPPAPSAPATTPDARAKEALDQYQKTLAELQAQNAVTTRTNTEDLGMMYQNGVPAQGTRTTLTIPVGQIGNNREIKVVNERWYSQDLQMTVKSMNSDPRFGTTTYEMKNIVRANPDASLFQIPSDYTTLEGGGRRGAQK